MVNARHGPFHRLSSPTQSAIDAQQQVGSAEIWGKPARGSNIPSVKAYRGPLPSGEKGVEFYTDIAPLAGQNTPTWARWNLGHTPGVVHRTRGGVDYAAIPVEITLVRS
ncbi:MAG: hypothetical protein CMP81_13235 [Fulvimarina sp.]|nr:hypothetical protein [Fulvimarina sp.]